MKNLKKQNCSFLIIRQLQKKRFYYRRIFQSIFHKKVQHKQFKWIPKWQENQDPSGRANAAHVKADVSIEMVEKEVFF